MSKKVSKGIESLLALFEPYLDSSDIIEAKLMSQVSTAIVKERIRLGMNQTEFAKYLGVQQSMVSRWENGDYNFALRKLAEISAKLDFNADIVFNNSNTVNTIKRIVKTNQFGSANLYSFSEYKGKKNSFKGVGIHYIEEGWKNAAVH